jgi:hypothetical protein
MKRIVFTIATIIFLFQYNSGYAQLDSIMERCASHLDIDYVSDGQQYKALLNGEEIAEFYTTFYGGSTYRLVGYGGLEEGNLIFSVYDKARNLLYSNEDYSNSAYWDLKFNSTVDCIIEAKLDSKNLASGFAIMLIGFKQ